MTIRFVKLFAGARTPKRSTDGAAGFDLYTLGAPDKIEDSAGWPLYDFRTGLAVELPPGTFLMLTARSSLAKRGFSLSNGVGIIDEDYRGELMYRLRPSAKELEPPTEPDLRLVQIILMRYEMPVWEEVSALSESGRGEGGYGSTGH